MRFAMSPENPIVNKITVQPRKSRRGNVYVQYHEGVESTQNT